MTAVFAGDTHSVGGEEGRRGGGEEGEEGGGITTNWSRAGHSLSWSRAGHPLSYQKMPHTIHIFQFFCGNPDHGKATIFSC